MENFKSRSRYYINQCISMVKLRGQIACQKLFLCVLSITYTCILIIGKLTPANKMLDNSFETHRNVLSERMVISRSYISMTQQRDMQCKSRYAPENVCGKLNITLLCVTRETHFVETRICIMSFVNKLCTNATRFLNLVFNISESRFEGYPARRYDCRCIVYINCDICIHIEHVNTPPSFKYTSMFHTGIML